MRNLVRICCITQRKKEVEEEDNEEERFLLCKIATWNEEKNEIKIKIKIGYCLCSSSFSLMPRARFTGI